MPRRTKRYNPATISPIITTLWKILGFYEDDEDVSKYKALDEVDPEPVCMVVFSWLLTVTGDNCDPPCQTVTG